MKVSFEMPLGDYENLIMIIQRHITKHKHEYQIGEKFTGAEKAWHIEHADYVQTEILDKIIQGTTREENEY